MKRLFALFCLGLLLFSCDKPEVEVAVSSVSLSQATAEMLVGETIRLTATVLPADAKDKTVTWASSKQSVATVSNSGDVTAVSEGETTITASAGGKSATCKVTVSKKTVPVESVTLNETTLSLEEGQSFTLVATVSPSNATDNTVTWSYSKQSVVTVSSSGVVTALAEGEATVTATAGGKSASCVVTVSKKVVPVESVSLNQSTAEMIEGETIQLKATVLPADATDKTVEWASSKQSVATVSPSGEVKAIAEGETTITASAGGKSATCVVKVAKKIIPVESVSLDKSSLSLVEGDTYTLIATVSPADATDKAVTWTSSKQSVATVGSNGEVKAIAEGEATITATAGGKSATCVVKVARKIIPVESVSLSQSTAEMLEGETIQLIATVLPADATDKTVTWASSKQSVATVSSNGEVKAIAEGQTTITASSGGKSATCVVTVNKKPVEVTSITLDRTSVSMEEGQTTMLVATVSPADATDKTVKWTTSKGSVASVDDYGMVTALAEGSAVITATAGKHSASCLVTVTKKVIPVSSVTLDRYSVTLEIGQSTTLVVTVSPADATDKTVSWTNSDESVISLDSNGKITALKEGTATVAAIAGDKSASCAVTVAKKVIPVSSVTLDKTSLAMEKGQTSKLVATVNPSDATDKTVTWNSSDYSVVSVDQDGNVKALKNGTATITAKAGEKSASCRVTVTTPVTNVSLDQSSLSLEVGQSATLTATVYPDDATDRSVSWTSSDSSVASVDAFGKVTALKKGSAVITAAAGGKSATCKVTVKNIPFGISPKEVSFSGAGGSFEIKVTCSGNYHLESKPGWVTEMSVNGTTHRFAVASNPDGSERTGAVMFCDDEGTCLSCVIKQAPGGNFTLNPSSVEIKAAGGTFTVKVACSTGYHLSTKPDWIEDISDPNVIQEHVFKVSQNPTEDDRNGAVTFCDDKGICLSCIVKQAGRDPDSVGGGNEDVPDGDPVTW